MKKLLPCEYPDCENFPSIRSKVKDRDSEFFGLYVCNYHANILRPKKVSDQTRKTREKRKEQRKDYPAFFYRWVTNIQGKPCAECGKPVEGNSSNVCHILAKSTSPEVATNDLNILVLCNAHHTKFDSSLSNRSGMDCFPQSVEHYIALKPLLKNITAETRFYEENLHMSN